MKLLDIFRANVLRHFLHGTSLFLVTFTQLCVLIPRIHGFTWSAIGHQDASKTPPGFWHEPLYIYIIYITTFPQDKNQLTAVGSSHPQGVSGHFLEDFCFLLMMEHWWNPEPAVFKCGWSMGESLTDYPPTTKYTWPLKVTIFINFPESFFLFQSIMFVCGVHVVQCPQPRCTSNKNSKRIAKPLFRKETPGTQHLGEPYSIQNRPSMAWKDVMSHTNSPTFPEKGSANFLWSISSHFKFEMVKLIPVIAGWLFFAAHNWFVRVWRSIHQVPH